MSRVLWMHDEGLAADHPLFAQYSGCPAVFVFDEAWIAEAQLSLKRIVFMYECLLEMPVEIRKGDVIHEVRAFAQRHQAETVLAPRSADPRLRRQGKGLGVTWWDPPEFVHLAKPPDLKRFSRYWRRAKNTAFTATEDQA